MIFYWLYEKTSIFWELTNAYLIFRSNLIFSDVTYIGYRGGGIYTERRLDCALRQNIPKNDQIAKK